MTTVLIAAAVKFWKFLPNHKRRLYSIIFSILGFRWSNYNSSKIVKCFLGFFSFRWWSAGNQHYGRGGPLPHWGRAMGAVGALPRAAHPIRLPQLLRWDERIRQRRKDFRTGTMFLLQCKINVKICSKFGFEFVFFLSPKIIQKKIWHYFCGQKLALGPKFGDTKTNSTRIWNKFWHLKRTPTKCKKIGIYLVWDTLGDHRKIEDRKRIVDGNDRRTIAPLRHRCPDPRFRCSF